MTEFPSLERRYFLGGALAAFPLALIGPLVKAPASPVVNPFVPERTASASITPSASAPPLSRC